MRANRVQRGEKESSRLHSIERIVDFRLPMHFQFHIIKMQEYKHTNECCGINGVDLYRIWLV